MVVSKTETPDDEKSQFESAMLAIGAIEARISTMEERTSKAESDRNLISRFIHRKDYNLVEEAGVMRTKLHKLAAHHPELADAVGFSLERLNHLEGRTSQLVASQTIGRHQLVLVGGDSASTEIERIPVVLSPESQSVLESIRLFSKWMARTSSTNAKSPVRSYADGSTYYTVILPLLSRIKHLVSTTNEVAFSWSEVFAAYASILNGSTERAGQKSFAFLQGEVSKFDTKNPFHQEFPKLVNIIETLGPVLKKADGDAPLAILTLRMEKFFDSPEWRKSARR